MNIGRQFGIFLSFRAFMYRRRANKRRFAPRFAQAYKFEGGSSSFLQVPESIEIGGYDYGEVELELGFKIEMTVAIFQLVPHFKIDWADTKTVCLP